MNEINLSNVKINSTDWKVKVNTVDPQPHSVLVSLYDLLLNDDYIKATYEGNSFDEAKKIKDKKQLRIFYDNELSAYRYTGFHLQHDIIAYDSSIYNSNNRVPMTTSAQSFEPFVNKGFHTNMPLYDMRTKPVKFHFIPSMELFDAVNDSNNRVENLSGHLFACTKANDSDSGDFVAQNSGISLFRMSSSDFPFYYTYNRKSALAPNNLEDIHDTAFWESNINNSAWGNYSRQPPSVGLSEGNTVSLENDNVLLDIILGDKDPIMQASLPSNLSSYTSVALNSFIGENPPDESGIKSLSESSFSWLAKMIYIILKGTPERETSGTTIFAPLKYINQETLQTLLCSTSFQEVIKNQYVWVRATFFADYVAPDSFNQDLNQDSDVIHKNMAIVSTGNFRKYDSTVTPVDEIHTETSSGAENADDLLKQLVKENIRVKKNKEDSKYRSENNRLYIPKTSPSLDLLSKRLVGTLVSSGEEGTSVKLNYEQLSKNTEKLFEPSKVPQTSNFISVLTQFVDEEQSHQDLYGSLDLAPIDRDTAHKAENFPEVAPIEDGTGILYHPAYFDPEARMKVEKEKNYKVYSHTPTIVPKDGNLTVDGRIFSPSIDELWSYLKRLVDGRINDEETIDTDRYTDMGRIIQSSDTTQDSSKMNDEDTRLPPSVNFELITDVKRATNSSGEVIEGAFDETRKFGDPLDLKIIELETLSETYNDSERNTERLIINSFVNMPEKFSFTFYEALKGSLLRLLTNSDLEDLQKYAIESEKEGYSLADYLLDFSPFQQTRDIIGGKYDDTKTSITDDKTKLLKPNTPVDHTSYFGPRVKPLSLRELELEEKQLKYNLITLIKFMETNLGIVGNLGKSYTNSDKETLNGTTRLEKGNDAEGTLYQFHKDFNRNPVNPNTQFAKVNNQDSGQILNDFGATVSFEDSRYSLNEDGSIETTVENSSKFNLDRDNYGLSIELESKVDSFTSDDVYLSASGKWKYLHERARIPVLKTRF